MSKSIPALDMQSSVVRVGQPRAYQSDLYAFLLRSKWRRLMLLCVVLYLAVNALFALLFIELGQCVEGARPGSFFDAFFFSVQTLATIGYGVMSCADTCS
jgi:inward rectifier potassium channel